MKISRTRVIISAIAVVIVLSAIYPLIPKTVTLQGEVVIRQLNVSPKITGRVLEVNVTEGDFVKKGEIIARIDSPETVAKEQQALAAANAAKAQYMKARKGARAEEIADAYNIWQKALVDKDLAKRTLERVHKLYEGGVVSEQQLDEARAKYEAAMREAVAAKTRYDMLASGSREEDKAAAQAISEQAAGALTEAESYVSETNIVAPRDGEISTVVVEQGEIIGAGLPAVTLLDLNDIWLSFNIREDLLKDIRVGNVIEVTIPALGNKKYKFKVTYLSKYGDFAIWSATKTRGEFDMKTFEMRAKPAEPIDGLRMGMSALLKVRK